MSKVGDRIRDNKFLTTIILIGISLGLIPPFNETFFTLGAAFIIAGGVGTLMMNTTKNVAKNLHERFNELTPILKRIDSSLEDISASEKKSYRIGWYTKPNSKCLGGATR